MMMITFTKVTFFCHRRKANLSPKFTILNTGYILTPL